MSSPRRISSSLTLVFRLFIPVFWLVFFGGLVLAILINPGEDPLFQKWNFKIGAFVFYLIGILFLYLTLLRLKRVEIDENFVYVTNFFKTYRYPFHNIDSVTEQGLILMQLGSIRFKEKGSFGDKIYFLESKFKFESALEEFIDLKIIYENSKKELLH